ncbi:hypothetical protein L3Q82_007763 [Scortum barcoo]|uniref:Uncharacterized protein n=1 Tax=Scortum barcoo TaxID=214431 RepID=A0ACB8WP00_9TELE|nr:hypothetical protein L3Q82_007763 [Scortum barcoo]
MLIFLWSQLDQLLYLVQAVKVDLLYTLWRAQFILLITRRGTKSRLPIAIENFLSDQKEQYTVSHTDADRHAFHPPHLVTVAGKRSLPLSFLSFANEVCTIEWQCGSTWDRDVLTHSIKTSNALFVLSPSVLLFSMDPDPVGHFLTSSNRLGISAGALCKALVKPGTDALWTLEPSQEKLQKTLYGKKKKPEEEPQGRNRVQSASEGSHSREDTCLYKNTDTEFIQVCSCSIKNGPISAVKPVLGQIKPVHGVHQEHEQKNIKTNITPDWRFEPLGPTLEPGLGLGLHGQRLVAGSFHGTQDRPGSAREIAWARLPVGSPPAGRSMRGRCNVVWVAVVAGGLGRPNPWTKTLVAIGTWNVTSLGGKEPELRAGG